MSKDFVCPHCGKEAEDEWDLQIMHRGCRLRAMAEDIDPSAVTELGDGLISIDVKKLFPEDEDDDKPEA